ncbi:MULTISPECIES: hypothetical protein [Streptomyces]|uniref:Uncharacterized protein n=1 Tax=Streptomyces nymphaeiformis TaxID=2663842 RepID=A0A7W7TXE9_9ACTN|nr:hypothetical protein [Streptomyces nymphaeiformis]MBB4981053.1 hypothetical protein [Streptomyces nymphaeiformis]
MQVYAARIERLDATARGKLLRGALDGAAAAVDPDDEVATALEAAARSAAQRGGASASVAWLSEHAADRSRHLHEASYIAG